MYLLVGDFSRALKKVIEKYRPDRVIIEPSGVGKLSDVAKAVEAVREDAEIEITGKITVVDGKKAKMYMRNFGEFFKDQVGHASTIVISRTQMMSDEKVEECVHMLREANERAAIISTPWEQLGRDALVRALEHGAEFEELLEHHQAEGHTHHHHEAGHVHHDSCCDHEHHHEHHHHEEDHEHHHDGCCDYEHHHGHHHHHADEIFTSWGRETAHKYTDEELSCLVKALSETDACGTVLRSKGIIPMADGSWKQFDLVPEEYEVREGTADYTGRVCVIGTELKEDELLKLFHI